MAREPDWRDRWEFALARGVEGGLSRLPERWAERLGESLGRFALSPLGIRRAVVEANVRRAFPGADDAWAERVVRGAFEHLGREAIAMVRMSELPPAAVVDRVQPHGWDEVEAELKAGRGVILVTGHFGNWEIAAAYIAARGYPIDAVMKPLRNPLVDARLDETRRRLGIGTIPMRLASKQIPRSLAAGRVVGLVADQDAGPGGVFVPFFGHPASTHRGPALFALRFDAPLFACTVRRLPGGDYEGVGERIPVARTGDLEADIVTVTRAWTERLERAVRRSPEQYFWFHKRWKTPPPEPVGEGAGTN